jgi:hypothetical protein
MAWLRSRGRSGGHFRRHRARVLDRGIRASASRRLRCRSWRGAVSKMLTPVCCRCRGRVATRLQRSRHWWPLPIGGFRRKSADTSCGDRGVDRRPPPTRRGVVFAVARTIASRNDCRSVRRERDRSPVPLSRSDSIDGDGTHGGERRIGDDECAPVPRSTDPCPLRASRPRRGAGYGHSNAMSFAMLSAIVVAEIR